MLHLVVSWASESFRLEDMYAQAYHLKVQLQEDSTNQLCCQETGYGQHIDAESFGLSSHHSAEC